jgi:hypothetical protein
MDLNSIVNLGRLESPIYAPPDMVERDDVENVLGTLRGERYVTLKDGREVRIISPVQPWERENARKFGEIWIRTVTDPPDPIFGRSTNARIRTESLARGLIVGAGTFKSLQEQEQAREAAKKAKAARANRPVRHDLAARLPQLDHQPVKAFVLDRVADDEALAKEAIREAHASRKHLAAKHTRLIASAERPAVRGVDNVVSWLTSHGVELAVVNGFLDAKYRRADPAAREVVDHFRTSSSAF